MLGIITISLIRTLKHVRIYQLTFTSITFTVDAMITGNSQFVGRRTDTSTLFHVLIDCMCLFHVFIPCVYSMCLFHVFITCVYYMCLFSSLLYVLGSRNSCIHSLYYRPLNSRSGITSLQNKNPAEQCLLSELNFLIVVLCECCT